ncbi:hypothetical protein HQ945_05275 [Phyllobacterium sp. BT25]|uniref:Uncharacterized protein n=1 Tax=Phyllobacterium pellucidum TaxID=2740464 RepID=A0A849VPH7_9HYPH|nr:hypothetical protein [Phyllobacterium pellucidum]NTS30659.1 hypothetical protein [Phyllobacterium pellucidum]
MAIRPDYTAGTVSIAANGTVLTGVGTIWAAAGIKPGATFKTKNLDAIIASVDSNTQITLTEPWTGGALSGATYAIRYQPDGSSLTAKVQELIEMLGNGNLQAFAALGGAFDMIPIFTGPGALTLIAKNDLIEGVQTDAKVANMAGRAAYDASPTGFSVLVNDVGDGRAAIFFKLTSASGDWSTPAYLTGPNGTFQSKGTYSGATTYQIGDVVLQNGSSWIARVITTGNPPPTLPTTSNTQWFLLAAAGNGFVFKGDYAGATGYLKDDVVTNQGSSWIALQMTTGNAPPILPTTSNAYWKALAVRASGDVSGPASSVDGEIAVFNSTTGKIIKSLGIKLSSFTPANAFLNGDFLVYQRGAVWVNVGGGTFVADRWILSKDGSGQITAAAGGFTLGQTAVPGDPVLFLRMNQTVAGSGQTFATLAQQIEYVQTLAGKLCTLTLYVRNNAGTNETLPEILLLQEFGTGGSPSASTVISVATNIVIPAGGAWQKLQYVFTIPSVAGKVLGSNGDDRLTFSIRLPLNKTYNLDFAHASLSDGDWSQHPDPFKPVTYHDDLLKCQRFFELLNGPGTGAGAGFDNILVGRFDSAGQLWHVWDYKVVKRRIPAIVTTQSGTSSAAAYQITTSRTQFLQFTTQTSYGFLQASATAEF